MADMSLEVNIDPQSEEDWGKDEIIAKLHRKIQIQSDLLKAHATRITMLEDSLQQAELLMDMQRKSKETALGVLIAQKSRNQATQTSFEDNDKAPQRASAGKTCVKTKEKSTDTGTKTIERTVASQTKKVRTRWVGTQADETLAHMVEYEIKEYFDDTDDGF
jgi:hypothetical protein